MAREPEPGPLFSSVNKPQQKRLELISQHLE